ncbi:hypothetical protein [Ulvibacterium marinum]|uniref:Uncharacterized protein n=1 Tax=Ulvibacterium marinum TaxID=2419782 RepID=A0A3B0C5X7_9FLAO|nr:hypothetical protein [Ulvibacterium marinum]RKN78746.1 hypothetical protein D7Z94_21365 [Ulvibacterium marinum]
METRIDSDYKKAFNLGYEIAKELNLKTPMFKGQDSSQNSTNAIQAGMLHYIHEVALSKNKVLAKSVQIRNIKSKAERKGKNKNRGKGLSL